MKLHRIAAIASTAAVALAWALAGGGAAGAAPGVVLTWVGVDADVVGYGGENEQDGIPDAHFRVTFTVAEDTLFDTIDLVGTDAAGANPLGLVWTTHPGDQTILGVVQNGRRLNPPPGWNAMGGKIVGSATYDLYAADYGFFLPGMQYRVVFSNYTVVKGTATVAIPASAVPFARLSYRGVTADVVGPGSMAPDRQRDAQFQVAVGKLPKTLPLILVRLSNVTGAGGPTWSTQPDGPWVLGVVKNGKRLNPKEPAIPSVPHTAATAYQLFANDPAKLQRGQWYTAKVQWWDAKAGRARTAWAGLRLP